MLVGVTTSEALDVVLIVFLVVVGVALAYALWRLGTLLAQMRTTVRHTESEVLPLLTKTGGTLDRVNLQLDNVDVMTTSAVDAVTALDRAVRIVTAVVTAPVQVLAGLAEAIRYGISSLRTDRNLEQAVQTAKDAATRRMDDLAEDLDEAGRAAARSSPP
jgi:uncharacterized protein YoxC